MPLPIGSLPRFSHVLPQHSGPALWWTVLSLLAHIPVLSVDLMLPDDWCFSLSDFGCGCSTWCSHGHDEWLLNEWTSLTSNMTTCADVGCRKAVPGRFRHLGLCGKPEGCSMACCVLFRVNHWGKVKENRSTYFALKCSFFFSSGHFRITEIWCWMAFM